MSKVAVVMYHYVKDHTNRFKRLNSLSLDDFKSQIEYFSQNFVFISYETLVAATKGQCSVPENSILLTFDDGYIDHYTNVFPILKAKDIPAFFSMPGKIIAEKKMLDVNKIHIVLAVSDTKEIIHRLYEKLDYYRGCEYSIPGNEELYSRLAVPSRFDCPNVIFIKRLLQAELPERLRNTITDELLGETGLNECDLVESFYLNWQQVKEMHEAGMAWGIHGYDHYWMNRLEQPQLEEDINKALDVFSDVLPQNGWGCCYPYGSIDDMVKNTVAELGAVVGFTTRVAFSQITGDDCLALPRFDTNDFPPISTNYLLSMRT